MSEQANTMTTEQQRETITKLGKEAMYYRGEHARRMIELLDAPEETQRIQTWAELHIQWSMRLRTYAEVAEKLGLFESQKEYMRAIEPERETEDDH